MKTSSYTALLACASISALTSPVQSEDLILDYPLIAGDNTGTTQFDPTTGLFQVTSGARTLATDSTFVIYISPDSETSTRGMSIQFTYDPIEGVIDGVDGNDFELIGSMDLDGDYLLDITGVLLTGEILDFSYENNGTTDIYDFRFEVTGGELADQFPTGNFAIINVSENSTFVGDFGVAFSGEGKTSLGSIERLPDPEPEPEIVPEPEPEPEITPEPVPEPVEEDDCDKDRDHKDKDSKHDKSCVTKDKDSKDKDKSCDKDSGRSQSTKSHNNKNSNYKSNDKSSDCNDRRSQSTKSYSNKNSNYKSSSSQSNNSNDRRSQSTKSYGSSKSQSSSKGSKSSKSC
jgi:hypothetical protein